MKVFNKEVWFGGQKLVHRFAEDHKVGYLKVPDLSALPETMVFSASLRRAVPLSCLCLGAATKTEDQGSSPKCAAYSASSYAETILWRKTGVLPEDIDPNKLYSYAKAIDGDPAGEGTTIAAVLEALRHYGHFDSSCAVKLAKSAFDLKAAVHRYGACVLGLNISSEWYKGNRDITDTSARPVGGHAVLCPGYDTFGPWILNSWGKAWGQNGFAHLSWNAFNRQFIYLGFNEGVYAGMV